MKKDLILIVGASGTVGSEITKALKLQGYQVRVTTSKSVNANDKDTVHINLATGEGIKAALDGVDRAFFLSPPGYADQYRLLSPLIQEAKRKGLKKVVLMTAMGANAVETSPFRRAELELEKSGINYNIIRPNWFLQNFNTFWIQGIKEQRKILLPAGKAKVSFIDARDIAAVASTLLTSDNLNNRAFDLTGPEAVDHEQVAKAISQVTNKNISYQEIEPDVLRSGLLAAGLPADYSDFLLMILSFLKEGYNASVNENVKFILGREPKNLAQYAHDFKQSWL
ncbi:MAG: NmrA family NAD(P)-binding protein [Bdellovibrionaceae bacterium]|nr:NmrA family NAD(P)-binding protein [Pseudobdellovibrionaceae bacterium]NUM59823.1 NmrA family NAD(P)-binding protein [Pseudobdellovibrionaceae bacterium]